MKRPITIVGFMGAGKTTTARELARRHGCSVVDLDQFIAAGQGRTIAQIIDAEGEAVFRKIESEGLAAILARGAVEVIALGGGTWTIAENRDLIKSAGLVSVWLDVPFELCWHRIGASAERRPLGQDQVTAAQLYEARRPVYALADVRIEHDGDQPLGRALTLIEEQVARIVETGL